MLLFLAAAWLLIALLALAICRASGHADRTVEREDARLAAWLRQAPGGLA